LYFLSHRAHRMSHSILQSNFIFLIFCKKNVGWCYVWAYAVSVQQCSTVFSNVQQCSTMFNNVQQCSVVFNGVHQCSIVFNRVTTAMEANQLCMFSGNVGALEFRSSGILTLFTGTEPPCPTCRVTGPACGRYWGGGGCLNCPRATAHQNQAIRHANYIANWMQLRAQWLALNDSFACRSFGTVPAD
jgi:hypothetical protein